MIPSLLGRILHQSSVRTYPLSGARFLNTLRDTIPTIGFFRMRWIAYRQHKFSIMDPLESAMDLRNLYSHDSYVYKINTILSFTKWIDQLELRPGYLLDRHLPRHRSMLTVYATLRLLTITNSDDICESVFEPQNYLPAARGRVANGT